MAYKDLSVVLETHTGARELLLRPSGSAEHFDPHFVGLYVARIPGEGRKRGWPWS